MQKLLVRPMQLNEHGTMSWRPLPLVPSPGLQAVNTEMDGHLRDNPLHSPRGVMRAAVRGRISEDTPWNPPSMDAAREFESLMHLRRPEGGKFDATDLKTGRYCFLGGCGEQLDLWDEVKGRTEKILIVPRLRIFTP